MATKQQRGKDGGGRGGLEDYPGHVDAAQVATAWAEARTSPILPAIITVPRRNVTEHGITMHAIIDEEVVHFADAVTSPIVQERWTPLIGRIITDVLAQGYSVVIVDPEATDPERQVFVLKPEKYELRWREVGWHTEYAAFPRSSRGGQPFGGVFGGAGGKGGGKETPDEMRPIPMSYVHMVHEPTEEGALTSPTAQAMGPLRMIRQLMEDYVAGNAASLRPAVFLQPAAGKDDKTKVDLPMSLATFGPGGGGMNHSVVPVGPDSSLARSYHAAAGAAHAVNSMAGERAASGLGGSGQASVLPGRPTVYVPPGYAVVRDSAPVAPDARGTFEAIDNLVGMIGRGYGVSAEYSTGNAGAGSRLVTGVEASRRQLATEISDLQNPLAKFLQRVFGVWSRPLLRDLLSKSDLERQRRADRRGRPSRGKGQKRKRDASPSASDGGGDGGGEEEATGVAEVDAGVSGDVDGDGVYEGRREDRIVIQFNNIPYLDYDTTVQMVRDGFMDGDQARHLIARMYNLPESALTKSTDAVGPRELLVEPIVEATRAVKASTLATKKQAEAATATAKLATVGGAAVRTGGSNSAKPAVKPAAAPKPAASAERRTQRQSQTADTNSRSGAKVGASSSRSKDGSNTTAPPRKRAKKDDGN